MADAQELGAHWAPPSPPPPPPPARALQGSATGESAASSGGANAEKAASIKGWLKSTVSKVDENFSQIREGAQLAAQELQKGMSAAKVHFEEQRHEFIFIEKPLGLELDLSRGGVVRAVKPGGQGERLLVQPDDRLVAIAGKDLPIFEPGNADFIEEVQQRMRKMGRPVTLTFVRMVEVAPPADDSEKVMDTVKKGLKSIPGAAFSAKEPAGPELQAELQAARELAQRCKAEAAEAREEAKQQADDAIAAVEEAAALRADLADLQLSKVWKTQEAAREKAEADTARAETQQARDALAARDGELQRLQEAAASAEQASAAALQACTAQREEAERVQTRLDEALVDLKDLRQARASLQLELEEAKRHALEKEAVGAEVVRAIEAQAAAAIARAEQAERLQAEGAEALQEAGVREAAAKSEIDTLKDEVIAFEGEKQRLAAADKLLPELRREVERLRKEGEHLGKELRLFESANGGMIVPEAGEQEARKRVEELEEELERLRAVVQESGVQREQERGMLDEKSSADQQEDAPLENPGDMEAFGTGDAVDASDVAQNASSIIKASEIAVGALKSLELRIAELEHANTALTRQLNARPIVFQFGPSMEDEEEDDAGLQEEEDPEVQLAAFAAAAVPHVRSVVGKQGRAAERSNIVRIALMCLGAMFWIKRRLTKGFRVCRKQKLTKYSEKSLKYFTRNLLSRPVLLWMWYLHVLVLWCLEASRQAAVTHILSTDPAHRLDQIIHEQAALAVTLAPTIEELTTTWRASVFMAAAAATAVSEERQTALKGWQTAIEAATAVSGAANATSSPDTQVSP